MLPFNLADFRRGISTLQERDWIDKQTRIVTLDVQLLSYEIARWIVFHVAFELLPGGAVVPSYPLIIMGALTPTMVHDQREPKPADTDYYTPFYFLVLSFTVYYAVATLRKMAAKGWGWYKKACMFY